MSNSNGEGEDILMLLDFGQTSKKYSDEEAE